MKLFGGLFLVFLALTAILLFDALYTVHEREQVIITQFGRPIGDPITEAGLKVKIPFIQKINSIDRRILEWDGSANDMPTREKVYISVDTFGRWRIADALTFYERLTHERRAQSRLEDILGSETRNAVAKHELIEIIRSTKDRVPERDETMERANLSSSELLPIRKGRRAIEQEIFEAASGKLAEFGIELLDVRFKRINYNERVRQKIYERMISERQQIAERFRSEGAGEAAKILGNMSRELKEIYSVAYKVIQSTRGDADAKATEIYASAYNQSPEAIALYEFVKSMETYSAVLDKNTTVILSTESDLFKFLKGMEGE